jgi:hypothetical protein
MSGTPSTATPVDAAPGSEVPLVVGGLDIVDEAGAPVPQGKQWIVGERVTLTVQSSEPAQTLRYICWWLPLRTVSSQTFVQSKGSTTFTSDDELQQATLRFHWPAVPLTSELFVTALVQNRWLGALLRFAVVGPTQVAITSVTSIVKLGMDMEPAPPHVLSIVFGNADIPQYGISIRGTFMPPDSTPPDMGQCGFLQLIKSYRSNTHWNGDVRIIDSHDEHWLDDVPGGGMTVIGPQKIEPLFMGDPEFVNIGQAMVLDRFDAPSSPLRSEHMLSVAWDSFKTYLMYRPDRPNAIWVTLGLLEWRWGGVAERIKDQPWTLVKTPDDHAIDPKGTLTSELPEWTDWFTRHSAEL